MRDFQAGIYIKQGSYRSFQPHPINRPWHIEDMAVIDLLSQADQQLGRLDMYSQYVPNIDLFISMHVLKEATQSSRIEGTQTRIEEALLAREDVPPDKRDDWEEVQNYIKAMDYAMEALESLPFSSRLIRDTHRVLMQGVRGAHKQPGAFRHSQNWIGGSTIDDAVFVPPVHTSIPELMSDLEQFVHNTDIHVPPLIRIALIHYQFETIHPFLDGNGRTGRLLIPLYLVYAGILNRPILYVSDFFERNRSLYYDNLMRVRTHNDLTQWLKFFLIGIRETAREGVNTFDQILSLQKEIDQLLPSLGTRAAVAAKLMQHLYQRPLVDAETVAEVTGITRPTAYSLIKDLEQLGILREITGGLRDRRYLFDRYLALFQPPRE